MTCPSSPQFLASEYAAVPRKSARFHVFPVPYEKTVSYGGGTAVGPEAILRASNQLESVLGHGGGHPGAAGIFTLPAIDCSDIEPEGMIALVAREMQCSLAAGCVPVLLGGEHTVTLGAFKALLGMPWPVGIVQFDAHADLRAEYELTPYSHACVMHRAVEWGLPVFQIGVRSLCDEEYRFRVDRGIPFIDAETLSSGEEPAMLLPDHFPERIYITFDVDALDASLMPATGTPEPGGLFWNDALRLLRNVLQNRLLIGFDVVELAPIAGFHACDYTAAKLVYTLMGLVAHRA